MHLLSKLGYIFLLWMASLDCNGMLELLTCFKSTHVCGALQDRKMCTGLFCCRIRPSCRCFATIYDVASTPLLKHKHGLTHVLCLYGPHALWTCVRQPMAVSVQMPSTQNASLEPGLRAWPPWMFASQVEKMKNPLCRAGLDLCPGRRWETLLGRQKEVEELLRWVKTNCGNQRFHTHAP